MGPVLIYPGHPAQLHGTESGQCEALLRRGALSQRCSSGGPPGLWPAPGPELCGDSEPLTLRRAQHNLPSPGGWASCQVWAMGTVPGRGEGSVRHPAMTMTLINIQYVMFWTKAGSPVRQTWFKSCCAALDTLLSRSVPLVFISNVFFPWEAVVGTQILMLLKYCVQAAARISPFRFLLHFLPHVPVASGQSRLAGP